MYGRESSISLGNKNVTTDIIGDAYEFLIKKFADATNNKAGEFYTPRSVVRMMVDILDGKEVPATLFTPHIAVTAENIREIYPETPAC